MSRNCTFFEWLVFISQQYKLVTLITGVACARTMKKKKKTKKTTTEVFVWPPSGRMTRIYPRHACRGIKSHKPFQKRRKGKKVGKTNMGMALNRIFSTYVNRFDGLTRPSFNF